MQSIDYMNKIIKYSLYLILISAGLTHLVNPGGFAQAMPKNLPFPIEIIIITGFIEILAVVGLILSKTRLVTAYLLILYFLFLLPAHFEIIINGGEILGFRNELLFKVRIFVQIIPIFMAWFIRRSEEISVFPILDRFDNLIQQRWKGEKSLHSKWLLTAAFYNIGFGFWAVVFPNQLFELFSLELPKYPFIWQSVGMIVGVYGIGYGIGAINEQKHWPIVLVGLLGKIFGPIGFIWVYSQNMVPLEFGTILIFNDIIWWPVFMGIIKRRFTKI